MQLFEENGVKKVEYKTNKSEVVVSTQRTFVKSDKEFSTELDDSKLPDSVVKSLRDKEDLSKASEEDIEKISGMEGFSKLSDGKKKDYIQSSSGDVIKREKTSRMDDDIRSTK